MTPGARVAAAIAILDQIATGQAAEQALTRWARNSRFAGSKDRAAVRDHVFDVLRQRQTAAILGGGESGRALMIGLLRAQGVEPETLFSGEGHAPQPLTDREYKDSAAAQNDTVLWNLPDWLVPEFEGSLGPHAYKAAQRLGQRAPVGLRVNLRKGTVETARTSLRADGVETTPNPLCDTALTVLQGARRIRQSTAYQDGVIELQDAASQAVVAALPPAARVLDYCAGGGGKALALAALSNARVFAHDTSMERMRDIPRRAQRAGVEIQTLETKALRKHAPFDVVLCDAPCSGSGAWRRSPEAKWQFTPERLRELCATQDAILRDACELVTPGGVLAFATCSLLRAENEERVQAFLENTPDWTCTFEKRFDLSDESDGFYTAHLIRSKIP